MHMKRKLIIEIISALLIVFFLYNAISNYLQIQSLKNLLAFYTTDISGIAWTIIVVEAIIVLLLFIPRTRLAGLLTALLLILYAGYTVLRTPHFPHDFGGILNNLSSKQHILIYSLLVLLAIVGVWLKIKERRYKLSPTSEQVVFT
jgi:Methylamine utilisation protein MauE